jgi:hypothetical protein
MIQNTVAEALIATPERSYVARRADKYYGPEFDRGHLVSRTLRSGVGGDRRVFDRLYG